VANLHRPAQILCWAAAAAVVLVALLRLEATVANALDLAAVAAGVAPHCRV
jgi:hypothetical protein